MDDRFNVPICFHQRFLYFKELVVEKFSFLEQFSYFLQDEVSGQDETLGDFYTKLIFRNTAVTVEIAFLTDIVEGHKSRFPQVERLPKIDSLVTCSILRDSHLLIVSCYMEKLFPQLPEDYVSIPLHSTSLEFELKRVVNNYSDFFRLNLTPVLNNDLFYECYTDRDYELVFNEIDCK